MSDEVKGEDSKSKDFAMAGSQEATEKTTKALGRVQKQNTPMSVLEKRVSSNRKLGNLGDGKRVSPRILNSARTASKSIHFAEKWVGNAMVVKDVYDSIQALKEGPREFLRVAGGKIIGKATSTVLFVACEAGAAVGTGGPGALFSIGVCSVAAVGGGMIAETGFQNGVDLIYPKAAAPPPPPTPRCIPPPGPPLRSAAEAACPSNSAAQTSFSERH